MWEGEGHALRVLPAICPRCRNTLGSVPRSETARSICAADLARWVRDAVPGGGLAGRTQTRCQLIALIYYIAVRVADDAKAAWQASNLLVGREGEGSSRTGCG